MKALVVDDSALVRKQVRDELEEGGYEVAEAVDGIEAFKVLLTFHPDIISLDVDMPNMDGFTACEKLRSRRYSKIFKTERGTKIPVVFITGTDTMEGRARGFEAGATNFITKPFPRGDVLKAVNDILKPGSLLKGLTALVAEDSETTRDIVAEYLNALGATVLEAQNGKEAYEIFLSRNEQIDMVISDYAMPEMDGEMLCRKIRHELNVKDIPIIFLTGVIERSSMLELFDAGATDYLMKPFVKEELLARLVVHLRVRLLNRELQKKIAELTESEAKLRESNATKDKFFSILGHDLKGPIFSFQFTLDAFLDRRLKVDEETKYSMISSMADSSRKLYSLLENLLLWSSCNRGNIPYEPRRQKVLPIVSETMTHIQAVAEAKNVRIASDVEEDVEACLDKNMISTVIRNLVSNAIKFSHEYGLISISAVERGEYIEFSVQDQGVGMSPGDTEKLFRIDVHHTTIGTGKEKGTGLGLILCKEFVEKHGGRIWVESAQKKGTTFFFTLPGEGAGSPSNGASTAPESEQ